MINASNKILFLFLAILIIGFSFGTGYALNVIINTNRTQYLPENTPAPTPAIAIKDIPGEEQISTAFLPGEFYFIDTIIALTKTKPNIALLATVSRKEEGNSYIQNSRVSYFDGTNWERITKNQKTQNSSIVSNKLINSWNISVDPSRVLKQSVDGNIRINNTNISFKTNTLENEISLRSLPGYTKFLSNSDGDITIDGIDYPAFILYSRIYSLNVSDIQFYESSIGLTTDWIVFWDEEGNFFHIDQTNIENPTPIYQTHEIAVYEDKNKRVSKSFKTKVNRDSIESPNNYVVILSDPINANITFNRLNKQDKAPNKRYTWQIGTIEGKATFPNGRSVKGIGIVEYISD